MRSILIVATGGAVGSVARYLLSGFTLHRTTDWRFPLGTFLVNVLGCLAVGLIGGFVVKHDSFSSDARLFLLTGLAGGFTTFSAFGLETFYLLRRAEYLVAAGYVVSSVLLGLVVLWLGFAAVSGRS
jgi:fluoride exporter